MIELKGVTKIYQSKKGSETIALNDVSLQIADKGLVFIVGRSGSGKSTFLNLLGGLDSLTSGQILVGNQNIGDFKKEQYDSYRNSYVGFIFQEFNILEQYNVYENIELALKLQEGEILRSEVNVLLEKLGIGGLGERRVNELSGGQKQRVAIARALIKKPKIILADEPTGNLDKSSSEQIFDILKEISKEQLVVVVSHDKEAALKYGDRMIEIEDGRIINDSDPTEILDDTSLELKKSKLPFSYALKMALTSFKNKPFKLVMTIILTAMSLIFMGFTVNCALFDKSRLVSNTMRDNDNYIYKVRYGYYTYDYYDLQPLTDKNLADIRKITASKLNRAYRLYNNGEDLTFTFGRLEDENGYYDSITLYPYFVEIEDSRILSDLIGKSPKNSNEIVVHKYFAEYMMKCGIDTTDGLYFPKSFDEVITSNAKIKLGDNIVIITGIIDDDDSLYKNAKETGRFDSDELRTYFYNNYASKANYIYVNGFVDSAILGADKSSILSHMALRDKNYQNRISDLKALETPINAVTENGLELKDSLEKGEVILSVSRLKEKDSNFSKSLDEFLLKNNELSYDDAVLEFSSRYLKENDLVNLFLNTYLREESDLGEETMKIVGVSLDNHCYISNSYVEEYEPVTKEIDSVLIFDNDLKNLRKSFNQMQFYNYTRDIDFSGFYYNYTLDHEIDLANVMNSYWGLTPYILTVSIIFILFTYLLFSNFISTSISYCKKEIGILRALGASTVDVIKIFGYESLAIGIISYILSMVGWLISCKLLNKNLFSELFFTLNGIITHPLIPIIMLLFVIFISLFITITSVSKITKVKPIDAILNK